MSKSGTGNSTNSVSREDDGSVKPKKGIFGLFGKKNKEDSQNRSGTGGAQMNQPLSLKPIARR